MKLNNSIFGKRCIRCKSTQIHRAVGVVLNNLPIRENHENFYLYELSSRGALFKYCKRKYVNFYFSEYYNDYPLGLLLGYVPCQDVQDLVLKSETFDVVTSTEVFEHVPNDKLGFSEIYRVLKKGGCFIFTVPLNANQEKTVERITIGSDGNYIHHLEPEYHDDRITGVATVLTFRNYGLDIVERLKDVGFKSKIVEVSEKKFGIKNQLVIEAFK